MSIPGKVLLLLALFPGCASVPSGRPSKASFEGEVGDANSGDSVNRVFAGVLKKTPIGYLLYRNASDASNEDFSQALDVILDQKTPPPKALDVVEHACVAVTGVFTGFGSDTIGIGNFRSTIGFVIASSIEPLKCAQK